MTSPIDPLNPQWLAQRFVDPLLVEGAAPGKPCASVPCPSFTEGSIVHDDTFVPTLEDVRQAGGPWAGPGDRFYVERGGRVVLLTAEAIRESR